MSNTKEEREDKYKTHVKPRLQEIEAWARDGVSDKKIARNLDIAYSTFRVYKEKYKQLANVMKRSKDYVDNVVVMSAYLKRITGYDVTETKKTYSIRDGPDGKPQKILTGIIEQTRHIPGDPRAAEFFLAHRQPDKYGVLQKDDDKNENKGGIVLIPSVGESGGDG